MTITETRNRAFVENWFKSLVRSDGAVMTRQEWLEKIQPIAKKTSFQAYASKKICLEYKKLKKPKISYEIEDKKGYFYEVPKIIFDFLSLPHLEVQP